MIYHLNRAQTSRKNRCCESVVSDVKNYKGQNENRKEKGKPPIAKDERNTSISAVRRKETFS